MLPHYFSRFNHFSYTYMYVPLHVGCCVYVCEDLLCFFLCSVSFLSLCSVVHYASDCLYM